MEFVKKPWFMLLVAAGVAFLLYKYYQENNMSTAVGTGSTASGTEG